MKLRKLSALSLVVASLMGCGDGDVVLSPSTTRGDTITNNNGGGDGGSPGNNPCAAYVKSGVNFQGNFDGTNCTYTTSFVSENQPLTEDLFIPELENDGIHIFRDSLWIGEDVTQSAARNGVQVPQAGDGSGAILTIEAGSQIAFQQTEDYIRIARGSRIIAQGTEDNPIVLSAVEDLIDGTATLADRGLWGGVQINGNGLTNKCTDTQRQATANNVHDCHVTAEGRPATYGGNNNAESSGTLRYVIIKHAGFEVVDGDELNGLTLNAVGSGTTIEFVQTFTTQDDGFEMFGGAVNMKNIIAVNVGDDSIDYSEGYVGNIQFALVVHPTGANRCIEGDNTGGGRADDLEPLTKLRISNLTCVTSSEDEDMAGSTAPSAKGDSEGPLFREGAFFEMYNSIVTSNADAMASNECFEVNDSDGPQTIDGIEAGWSDAQSNLIACNESLKISADDANATFTITSLTDWFLTADKNNVVVDRDSAAGSLPAVVIDGLEASDTAYITASAFMDGLGNTLSVPVFDATTLSDSFEAGAVPAVGDSGSSSFFESVDFIGAVSANNDWVSGWAVGL